MIILRIDPKPKPRMVYSDKYKERPIVMNYFDYCDNLRMLCSKEDFKIKDEVKNLTFVIKMPKSWTKTKKDSMNGKPHQQRPDLDNLLKAFKDALLKDDSKVHTYINISKVWGYRGAILINNYISSEDLKKCE